MNTLDDLRRILEAEAGAAPGPDGVVVAAAQGAARIRRRRRVTAVSGVAALVAVVAMVAPIVADRRHADGLPPATVPVERATGQVTLGVDPASGYVMTSQDVDADGQRIAFRIPPAASKEKSFLTAAIAVDPDVSFDPSRLQAGERTTVSGREAWYVSDYPLGTYTPKNLTSTQRSETDVALVGWRDPSGIWVLAFQENNDDPDRGKLLAAAQALRIHPAQDMTLPISFGRLPDGLPLNMVRSDRRTSAFVTLGGATAPPDTRWFVGPSPGTAVMIQVQPGTELPVRGTRVARVAGHDAWYSKATSGTARGNGTLSVRAGNCTVAFSAWDEDQASAAQLREIAAAVTYADCTDPTTWGPAVRR